MKRPPLTLAARYAAIYLNMKSNHGRLVCEETQHDITLDDILGSRVHIDHNPALALRYRDEAGDFKPAANDPRHLDVVTAVGHIYRTAKRKGLHRGDQTEIAHSRAMRLAKEEHDARMREKAGGPPAERKPLTQLQRKAQWAKLIKTQPKNS